MKFAFHFPGQGSQSLRMLSELSLEYSIVRDIFDRASEVLHYDLWVLIQEDPQAQLNQTEFTQPAVLVADFALWECWKAEGGPNPYLLAGHSLGEYAALLAAEVFTLEAAVELVAFRGRAMQSAVPPGEGAMAVIIGLEKQMLWEVCREASSAETQVAPANFNSMEQTVVAGHSVAVDRAILLARKKQAKVAKRISVSVPSHCMLMKPAQEAFADQIRAVKMAVPKMPVIHNVDVSQHMEIDCIRDALVEQLVHPVRWLETVLNMVSHDIQLFIECGPGRVLAGLNKRIRPSVPTDVINTPKLLRSTVKRVKEQVASCL